MAAALEEAIVGKLRRLLDGTQTMNSEGTT
jgi:hypothetical protein